jgi:hypothetical protein
MTSICRGTKTLILSFSGSLRTMREGSATSRPTITTPNTGYFRLRLIGFTPTRFSFGIIRTDHKYVEVTYDLEAKRFDDVRRIVHIIFGVQG